MILLPGQTANATVKRDASNNVIYGITGTDDNSDKIVYARGVAATYGDARSQTNYGSYTINRPAAVERSFSTSYGTMTFPAVANGYEVGWNYYGINSIGISDTFDGSLDYETMKTWAESFTFASYYVMVGFYGGVNFLNLTINNSDLTFTVLAGNGGVSNKQTSSRVYACGLSTSLPTSPSEKTITASVSPIAPLTTTLTPGASSAVSSGGTIGWGNDNTNLRIQIILVPKEDGPTQVTWINNDYALQYNRGTSYLGTSQNLGNTGLIANPGFIARYIYVCPVTNTAYSTRTYSGTISHERTNSDGSKFIETASWNNPGSASANLALTQTN